MLGAGLASIRLDASNGGFELQIEATPGRSLPNPTISSNGKELVFTFLGFPTASRQSWGQTTRLDLRRPGRVQQSAYVPPLRARAVAPPVGDIAVGSMLISNRSYVNVSGPQVSLNLSNAPAKDALMSLARLGDYGFVFVGGAKVDSDSQTTQSADGRNVTMSFREERFDRALNSVLMASGLQAKLDGRTLLVGESVSGKTFGPKMSKVYRLNQADAGSAADYLASLGAQISKVNITSITSDDAS
jgi:type IV pilus assembly protein PilQ